MKAWIPALLLLVAAAAGIFFYLCPVCIPFGGDVSVTRRESLFRTAEIERDDIVRRLNGNIMFLIKIRPQEFRAAAEYLNGLKDRLLASKLAGKSQFKEFFDEFEERFRKGFEEGSRDDAVSPGYEKVKSVVMKIVPGIKQLSVAISSDKHKVKDIELPYILWEAELSDPSLTESFRDFLIESIKSSDSTRIKQGPRGEGHYLFALPLDGADQPFSGSLLVKTGSIELMLGSEDPGFMYAKAGEDSFIETPKGRTVALSAIESHGVSFFMDSDALVQYVSAMEALIPESSRADFQTVLSAGVLGQLKDLKAFGSAHSFTRGAYSRQCVQTVPGSGLDAGYREVSSAGNERTEKFAFLDTISADTLVAARFSSAFLRMTIAGLKSSLQSAGALGRVTPEAAVSYDKALKSIDDFFAESQFSEFGLRVNPSGLGPIPEFSAFMLGKEGSESASLQAIRDMTSGVYEALSAVAEVKNEIVIREKTTDEGSPALEFPVNETFKLEVAQIGKGAFKAGLRGPLIGMSRESPAPGAGYLSDGKKLEKSPVQRPEILDFYYYLSLRSVFKVLEPFITFVPKQDPDQSVQEHFEGIKELMDIFAADLFLGQKTFAADEALYCLDGFAALL